MKEKFGPVPLKNDEKARISAEYATILVHVTTLKENANIKTRGILVSAFVDKGVLRKLPEH